MFLRTLTQWLVLSFLTTLSLSTFAATLNVNTQSPLCDDISGTPYCQIQAAIDAALSGDNIVVASGTYFGQMSSTAVMVIPTSKNISISGAGADNTILSGNNQGRRGIIVQAGASASISGFRITGVSQNIDNEAHGGGVQNLGTLTLSNCIVDNNTTAGNGGGIYSEAVLTVKNCLISNNTASRTNTINKNSGGGGIYATGQLELRDSVIYNNQAVHAGGGLMLDNLNPTGNAQVINSRILKNSAKFGGGIHSKMNLNLLHSTVFINNADSANEGHGGGLLIETALTANIVNSLIYFNQAYGDGGGLFHGNTTQINIYSSSIINNTTLRGDGGGIYANKNSGSVTLGNSLVSGNRDRGVSATNPHSPDCTNTLQSLGYNLISNNRNCYLASSLADIQNTNAKLAIISHGSGAEQTITLSLNENSPATDKANPNDCLDHQSTTIAFDLAGNARTQDGDSDGAPRCDIGAFEKPNPRPIIDSPIASTAAPTASTPSTNASSGGGAWDGLALVLLFILLILKTQKTIPTVLIETIKKGA